MQRDLTDSTVLRNLGVAFGHSFLGWKSLQIGIAKLEVSHAAILDDLNAKTKVLVEAIQTILRKNGDVSAYEKLKKLTRGVKLSVEQIGEFIENLNIPAADRKLFLELTPKKYVGIASKLVK